MRKNIIVSNRLPVNVTKLEKSFLFKSSSGGLATWLKSINPNEYFFEVANYTILNWYISKIIKIYGVQEVEEIDECPICFTTSSDMITSCDHQFCRD